MPALNRRIRDVPTLRNRAGVLRDRRHAGEVLAGLLVEYRGRHAGVFAIPAGGLPVGAELAARLALPLDVAVVSKITLPWNPEAGYGAVAFDGTVVLNDRLIPSLGLSDDEVERGIAMTREKVARRVQRFREGPFPDLTNRAIILVDDGLASGFTLRAAIRALRRLAPAAVIVAVPTAHQEAAEALAPEVDAFYCANVRAGSSFAVADAYERWYDVSETEAAEILEGVATRRPGPP
jgi:predicted phosphoribosyltransferase